MSTHLPNNLPHTCIPYLRLSLIRPNRQMLSTITPAHTGNRVLLLSLAQLLNLLITSRPYIHRPTQPHCQYILTTPIHKVQIEIIRELWSIQYFKGHFIYFPLLMAILGFKGVLRVLRVMVQILTMSEG